MCRLFRSGGEAGCSVTRHKLGPARDRLCVLCGVRATNWHHRLTRSRGGLDDELNLVPLCGSGTQGCHRWVTAHPDGAERLGLYVRGSMVRGVYVGPDPEYREFYNREVAV